MKKLLFIPALLTIAILFTACGGDKKPGDLPGEIKTSAEKTFPELVSPADVVQSREIEFKLADFPGVSQYNKWLVGADVPMSSSTFIELKGIGDDEGAELKDVSISLASTPARQFPFAPSNTLTENEKFAADRINRVAFFQAVIDEVRIKGSSKIVLKYTPSSLLVNPDIKMTMKIDAEFFFN